MTVSADIPPLLEKERNSRKKSDQAPLVVPVLRDDGEFAELGVIGFGSVLEERRRVRETLVAFLTNVVQGCPERYRDSVEVRGMLPA